MDNVQDLACYFVVNITNKTLQHGKRIESACTAIEKLLVKGWTVDLIKLELDAFKRSYPSVLNNIYHIEEIMNEKVPPHNLIEPDVFYYHNRLRETAPPSRLRFNKETREYECHTEAFFLEMKKLFTLEDLLAYWYESNKQNYNENTMKQDKGRFKHLLGFYDIDEILFMIDIAQEKRQEMKLRALTNAFHIEKYIDDARDAIKAKRNIHQMQGINHVIPRKVANGYEQY
ncbi:hypothetical protein [Virgibacillus salexigens]|uniref:Uncharacterized protein n=1 Tax=Virgibacillus massiliensis TaxID=1462526 RepID=A0A024QHP7_9BACI|nr:hypothetical protein [Virgibacillus massiliensis]CDQ41782.1 hypothetical protein BN990_04159 [Virgibacillus massiliensis]